MTVEVACREMKIFRDYCAASDENGRKWINDFLRTKIDFFRL